MPGPYTRVFWTVEGKVDKDGHPIEFPTEAAARQQASAGGIAGTGIGAGLGPVPAATPPVKVTEVMTEDGEYVQTVDGPDGQPQEIARGVDKARLDLYEARQDAAAATAKATAEPEAPTVRTRPDGSQEEWDPTTRTWKPHAPAAPAKRAAPTLDLGAPRPGQKTNLTLVEQQYNLFAQQLAADPNITDEEYNRRLQQYIATYVKPAVQAATEEANAEAARQQARQEAQDAQAAESAARAARSEERGIAREERADTLAGQTEARTFAEFQQRAGQNAVSNALALLPYRANPLFLQQYAAGLNTLAGGGGTVNFTPEAFQVPLPDLDALAAQGAERAAALYRAAGGLPVAPRPAAGAVAPTTPAGMPPPYSSMPGAPGSPLYPPSPEAALEAIPLVRRPPQV